MKLCHVDMYPSWNHGRQTVGVRNKHYAHSMAALGLGTGMHIRTAVISILLSFPHHLHFVSHYQKIRGSWLCSVPLSPRNWQTSPSWDKVFFAKNYPHDDQCFMQVRLFKKYRKRHHGIVSLQFHTRNCEAMVLWSAFRGALSNTYILVRHVSWCRQKKNPGFCMFFWTKT